MGIAGKGRPIHGDSSTMKRILSVLSAVLLAGALAVPAFAQEPKVKLKSATAGDVPAHWKAGETFQDCEY